MQCESFLRVPNDKIFPTGTNYFDSTVIVLPQKVHESRARLSQRYCFIRPRPSH